MTRYRGNDKCLKKPSAMNRYPFTHCSCAEIIILHNIFISAKIGNWVNRE